MDGGSGERSDEDPGWHVGWHSLVLWIPYVQLLYMRRKNSESLESLRSIYLSFPGSLILFGLLLPFVVPFRVGRAIFPWAIALVALAIVTYVLPRAIERPLPCDALAAGFRTRMFLRIAFANTIALFGFAFAFTAMSSWLYYFALVLSVPGLLRAAPTRGALIREQDELTARGCDRSLVAALRSTPPRPR